MIIIINDNINMVSENLEYNFEVLKYPNMTPQENLNILNNCNCCDKHKINKPKFLVKWVELPDNNGINTLTSNTDSQTGELYCKCDCRHLCRFICRKYG
jgi:hypothetical protein